MFYEVFLVDALLQFILMAVFGKLLGVALPESVMVIFLMGLVITTLRRFSSLLVGIIAKYVGQPLDLAIWWFGVLAVVMLLSEFNILIGFNFDQWALVLIVHMLLLAFVGKFLF